ncbi:hypothetical protein [Nocardia sp. NPDC004604]|uniref:hypothetical protein n=1 Tax=Nocardia sp. NPDC004604 TaxID=3157013 RepID=UPI0033A94EB7
MGVILQIAEYLREAGTVIWTILGKFGYRLYHLLFDLWIVEKTNRPLRDPGHTRSTHSVYPTRPAVQLDRHADTSFIHTWTDLEIDIYLHV